MKYYCFVYPDRLPDEGPFELSSSYTAAEDDDAAIELAGKSLMDSGRNGCPEVYGGRIIVIRCTASGDRVYTKAIAELTLAACDCCEGAYVEVFA